MMNTTKHVISKSAKRKMTTGNNIKANAFTKMVVYKTTHNGCTSSVTKHELASKE